MINYSLRFIVKNSFWYAIFCTHTSINALSVTGTSAASSGVVFHWLLALSTHWSLSLLPGRLLVSTTAWCLKYILNFNCKQNHSLKVYRERAHTHILCNCCGQKGHIFIIIKVMTDSKTISYIQFIIKTGLTNLIQETWVDKSDHSVMDTIRTYLCYKYLQVWAFLVINHSTSPEGYAAVSFCFLLL